MIAIAGRIAGRFAPLLVAVWLAVAPIGAAERVDMLPYETAMLCEELHEARLGWQSPWQAVARQRDPAEADDMLTTAAADAGVEWSLKAFDGAFEWLVRSLLS